MKHFMGIFLIIFLVRLRSMVRKVKKCFFQEKKDQYDHMGKKMMRLMGISYIIPKRKMEITQKLKTFTSRNNLSYTHTKLTNGTAYYYKIQAYKNFNGGKLYGSNDTLSKIL